MFDYGFVCWVYFFKCWGSETKKDIETASQMKDYIPLTAKKLKKIILEDTTHYKLVIFYGTNCGPCVKNMIEVYPKILNKVGDTEVKGIT